MDETDRIIQDAISLEVDDDDLSILYEELEPSTVTIKHESLDLDYEFGDDEGMLNEDPGMIHFEPGNSVCAQMNNAVFVEGKDAVIALKEILFRNKARDDELMAEIDSILEDTDSDMVSTLTLDQLEQKAEVPHNPEAKVPSLVHVTSSKLISDTPFIPKRLITAPEPTPMDISAMTPAHLKTTPSATVTSGDLENEAGTTTGTKLVTPMGSHQFLYKSKASSRTPAPASNRSGASTLNSSRPVSSGSRLSASALDRPGPSNKAKFVKKKLSEMNEEQKERVRVRRRDKIRALSRAALNDLQHIPTLNRPVRTAPYQPIWTMPLSDNESLDDEETILDRYSRTAPDRSTPSARFEHDWKLIYYNEKTAREFSEWMLASENPVVMPVQTLAETRVRMRAGCFVPTNPTQEVHEFKAGSTVSEHHEAIQTLLTEVGIYKYCSFDTEGDGQLLDKSGREPRLFVAFSTPFSATILLFHDVTDIPDAIRGVLLDYTVAKIQSGIGGDVALMEEHGIKVRGIVDSGTLYMLVKPALIDSGFGAKHQIEAKWPEKQCHQPYKWNFRVCA